MTRMKIVVMALLVMATSMIAGATLAGCSSAAAATERFEGGTVRFTSDGNGICALQIEDREGRVIAVPLPNSLCEYIALRTLIEIEIPRRDSTEGRPRDSP